MRPRIVHIAIDYDNPHRGRPTRAIKDFIDRLDFADNTVISLKRRANPLSTRGPDRLGGAIGHNGLRVAQINYWGLPGGILLALSMRIIARRVLRILKQEGIIPDVVHAHKLTFEGIAGDIVAREYGAALFASIRGEVEEKVFKYKPNYRVKIQRIISNCDRLYFVSAWFEQTMSERNIIMRSETVRLLPNWVKNETPNIVVQEPNNKFVSVLNLNDWKRKGLKELLSAIALLRSRGVKLNLDIIGSGSAEAERGLREEIARQELESQVNMLGRIDNDQLLALIGRYIALVLPSKHETFGMVYAEALFAGVPVIMNRNSGVDGYLTGLEVALYTQPGDAVDIAAKLEDMILLSSKMRKEISQNGGEIFDRFSSAKAVSLYREDVFEVVGVK